MDGLCVPRVCGKFKRAFQVEDTARTKVHGWEENLRMSHNCRKSKDLVEPE